MRPNSMPTTVWKCNMNLITQIIWLNYMTSTTPSGQKNLYYYNYFRLNRDKHSGT